MLTKIGSCFVLACFVAMPLFAPRTPSSTAQVEAPKVSISINSDMFLDVDGNKLIPKDGSSGTLTIQLFQGAGGTSFWTEHHPEFQFPLPKNGKGESLIILVGSINPIQTDTGDAVKFDEGGFAFLFRYEYEGKIYNTESRLVLSETAFAYRSHEADISEQSNTATPESKLDKRIKVIEELSGEQRLKAIEKEIWGQSYDPTKPWPPASQ